jgi:hypothetical protein
VPARALDGRVATRVQPFLPQDLRVDPDSAPGHAALGIYFFAALIADLHDHRS